MLFLDKYSQKTCMARCGSRERHISCGYTLPCAFQGIGFNTNFSGENPEPDIIFVY